MQWVSCPSTSLTLTGGSNWVWPLSFVWYSKGHCAVLSCSVMSESLRPHGLWPTRLLYLWWFSRQEYWSGLSCPSPGDLSNPMIKSSLACCNPWGHKEQTQISYWTMKTTKQWDYRKKTLDINLIFMEPDTYLVCILNEWIIGCFLPSFLPLSSSSFFFFSSLPFQVLNDNFSLAPKNIF